jgi:hypothetical protein
MFPACVEITRQPCSSALYNFEIHSRIDTICPLVLLSEAT